MATSGKRLAEQIGKGNERVLHGLLPFLSQRKICLPFGW
jgi:hypothetical protein